MRLIKLKVPSRSLHFLLRKLHCSKVYVDHSSMQIECKNRPRLSVNQQRSPVRLKNILRKFEPDHDNLRHDFSFVEPRKHATVHRH